MPRAHPPNPATSLATAARVRPPLPPHGHGVRDPDTPRACERCQNPGMLLIAVITVRRDELATFHAYERAAARVMAHHGGRIEHAYVLAGADYRELHVVRFPDEDAFDAYRRDPE